MISSIKQTLRKPIKLILLIILVMSSTIIFIYGFSLYSYSKQELKALESSYYTIGYVEQKPTSTKVIKEYDSFTETYIHYKVPVYDQILSVQSLMGYDDYMIKPEKRPFYGAYMEDYWTYGATRNWWGKSAIEFTPIETCKADQPVLIQVTKILDGSLADEISLKVGDKIWFCNAYAENKDIKLYKDKKYVTIIWPNNNATGEYGELGDKNYIFEATDFPSVTCYDEFGNKKESKVNNQDVKTNLIEEVTYNFYENGRGKYWENYMKAINRFRKSIPVIPTNGIELISPFRDNRAYIIEGRKISKDEFKNGRQVCMIPQIFALENELEIGDKINLPLYFSNYDQPSKSIFGGSYQGTLLDVNGELLPIFSNNEYEIVGIYATSQLTLTYEDTHNTELAEDLVIIPKNSMKDSDKNNINGFGPMNKNTTAFQIPNGTMDRYKKWFEENDLNQIFDLTLDDGGFEKIQSEMESNIKIANIMCVSGIITFLLSIIFIVYFFIIKEKKIIAINRSLGMTKKQCSQSLLYGLVIFTLGASMLGSIISSRMISRVGFQNDKTYYSEEYSLIKSVEKKDEIDIEKLVSTVSYVTPICFTIIVTSLSTYIIYNKIDDSLMELLNTRE